MIVFLVKSGAFDLSTHCMRRSAKLTRTIVPMHGGSSHAACVLILLFATLHVCTQVLQRESS